MVIPTSPINPAPASRNPCHVYLACAGGLILPSILTVYDIITMLVPSKQFTFSERVENTVPRVISLLLIGYDMLPDSQRQRFAHAVLRNGEKPADLHVA